MSQLDLYLFGTPRIKVNGQAVHIPRRKATALFVYLALTGRIHNRDALATLLWPENDQSSARAELRRGLYFINQALGNQWLETDLETAGLSSELSTSTEGELWMDVVEFQEKLKASETHDHPPTEICPDCIPYLEGAVDLYTDHFMAGFSLPNSPAYDEWQFFQAEGLRGQLASALTRLSSYYATKQEFETAIRHTRRWLTLDPLHEPAHQNLMALYAGSGQKTAAVRQYELYRQALVDELGAAPSEELIQLYERIKVGEFKSMTDAGFPVTAPVQEDEPAHNLPRQLTSFIGREAEIQQVLLLLEQAPQVTVVGHGGIGKTRLAIQVSRAVLDRFQDGVWLVDLAPLSDPEKVPQTAARSVGILVDSGAQALEALLDYIRPRQLLMVLDNCEHLIDACAQLAEAVLIECPQVKILATSRETLGTTGESVLYLPSLSVPNPDDMPEFDQITQFEAIELFAYRASAVQSHFALDIHNAPDVIQVCNRLDGIPLAIELAAAWVRTLQVDQISRRLSENIDLLRSSSRTALPRHQTLRACLDWSYELLSSGERHLLSALSVFAGGWTLVAAEAVCARSCEAQFGVLDLLDQLVAKSLVIVEHHPEIEPRYRLLEPVRQYAREKLHHSGEMESVRDRHLAYFQGLAEQAKPHLRAHRQIEWMRRLERELANIRVALDWAYSEDGPMERLELGLRIASDLRWFWQCRYRHLEGFQWMRRLLDLEQQRRGDQPLSASMCQARAWTLTLMVDLSKTHPRTFVPDTFDPQTHLDESLALFSQQGEAGKLGRVYTEFIQLWVKVFGQDCITRLEEIYSEFEQLGEKFHMAECFVRLGTYLFWLNQPLSQSETYFQKCLELCLEIGDQDYPPYLLALLGIIAIWRRDLERATACADEAIQIVNALSDELTGAAFGCWFIAKLFWCLGDYHHAEKYYQIAISKTRNQGLIFESQIPLCCIAMSQGDYARARELLMEIHQSIQSKEDNMDYAFLVRVYAELEWGMGNYAQAKKWLAELKRIISSSNYYDDFNHHRNSASLGLARLAYSKRDWNEAASQIEAALKSQIKMPIYSDYTYEDHFSAVRLAAMLASARKVPETTARLLGAAHKSYQANRLTFPLFRRQLIDQTIEDTRAALDEETFTTAWSEGKAMDLNEALVYALEVVEEIQLTKPSGQKGRP